MEGPEIKGPKVWLDLNRKSEAKIISFFEKNKTRSSWMAQYYEDCKAKLAGGCSEPDFVPKTPVQPKRKGRRGKKSTSSANSNTLSTTQPTRATRSTRVTRAVTSTTSDECKVEESLTPPPKKANNSIQEKSVVFAAEVANATYSSTETTDLNCEVTDEVVDEAIDGSTNEFETESRSVVLSTNSNEISNSDSVNKMERNDKEIVTDLINETLEAVSEEQEVIVAEGPNTVIGDDFNATYTAMENDATYTALENDGTNMELENNGIDAEHVGESEEVVQPEKEVESDQTDESAIVQHKLNGNSIDPKIKGGNCMPSPIPIPAPRRIVPKPSDDQTDSDVRPVRSTRTRQKKQTENVQDDRLPSSDNGSVSDEKSEDSGSCNDELPKRSTRTRQRNQLVKACSESVLTKGSASPRVRQLAEEALSPACTSKSTSRLISGCTGSPVKDRVRIFEEAMKKSAGLKSKRKSSIAESLRKVSAARNLSVQEAVSEVLADHDVVDHVKMPSSDPNKSALNTSRAPTGKIVRPGRKVFASGGRGVSPAIGPRSGNLTGSSSHLMKSRSRLNISGKITTPNKATTPNNMTRGSSFLPAKPKGPTLKEIQEKKDEERRMKEQREVEVKQRREEQMKNKAEEQRLKREERIKRVQEARQKQESIREDRKRKNEEKEKEAKLAMLKKREDGLKAEAEKRKRENELRLQEEEERKARELSQKKKEKEKLEAERRDEERRREEEYQRKQREEAERKKKLQEEEARRMAKLKEAEEAKRAAEEKLRKEKELRLLREREMMNTTVTKETDVTLNRTQVINQSTVGISSYDMTPARHELPPEPPQDENNYGLEDLRSDEDTDDEDCPRKQVPKWAEGTNLRTALLKQCYMGPDLDMIFQQIEMPDLAIMFAHQRKRFYKRTSSACWNSPPESFKHSKRQ